MRTSAKKVHKQLAKTRMCGFFLESGTCVYGSNCTYAHTEEELCEGPDFAMTKLCPQMGSCENPKCRYAHDIKELRSTESLFKTRLCKFEQEGHCALGDQCRHIHQSELKRQEEERKKEQFLSTNSGAISRQFRGIGKMKTKSKKRDEAIQAISLATSIPQDDTKVTPVDEEVVCIPCPPYKKPEGGGAAPPESSSAFRFDFEPRDRLSDLRTAENRDLSPATRYFGE
jgi:hypothetical protein